MTQPWEETWVCEYDENGGYDCITSGYRLSQPGRFMTTLATFDTRKRYAPDEEVEARAKLAAAAPEMARLLLELEYVDGETWAFCPSCGSRDEHASDCKLMAALRKAGVK